MADRTLANDDGPRQEMATTDHRYPADWPTLALLGIAGVVVFGSFSVFVWAIWKVVTLFLF